MNYFCKKIIRKGHGKIIPYKGAVIDIEKNARLSLDAGDLIVGANKLRGSRIETYLRMRENSKWNASSGCELSYGATVEILRDARIDSGYFTMNSFSTMIAPKEIKIGEDVMIARNVIVFDSDFHSMKVKRKNVEFSKAVKIGNHVWLCADSIILKGVTIGDNSIVSANSVITDNIIENVMVGNAKDIRVLRDNVEWTR